MVRRWCAVTLVAAVMMVPMAACADDAGGGATPPPTDPAALARLVDATRAIDSGRVEVRTTYAGLGGAPGAGPDAVRMVQRAAFDRRAGRAEAETDMSELAALLDARDADVPGDYTEPTRLVIDGETVYAQVGPLAPAVGLAPTTWVRRDLRSFAGQGADNETAALLLEPLGLLDVLRGPIERVEVMGHDEVRGAPATRLTATVGVAGSGAGDAGGEGDGGGADERLHALGIDALPVDVWVGDADRTVRRLAFSLAAGGAGTSTTVDIYDVGEPIAVAVPDDADVVDQADLAARLGPD